MRCSTLRRSRSACTSAARSGGVVWPRIISTSGASSVERKPSLRRSFRRRKILLAVRTTIARVVIPALVRGDELVTKTGCYGDLIRECQRIERDGTAMAAGIMIGNPFTDVPELCCQTIVMAANDEATATREAVRLAEEFWPQRHRMQGKFISLDRAIALRARSSRRPAVDLASQKPNRSRAGQATTYSPVTNCRKPFSQTSSSTIMLASKLPPIRTAKTDTSRSSPPWSQLSET